MPSLPLCLRRGALATTRSLATVAISCLLKKIDDEQVVSLTYLEKGFSINWKARHICCIDYIITDMASILPEAGPLSIWLMYLQRPVMERMLLLEHPLHYQAVSNDCLGC